MSNINPEGPSKTAGVQEGDVILKFNNIKIIKMTDLPRVVAESDVGSIAKLEVWRRNKMILIELELGELPEETFVKREIKDDNLNEIYIKNLDLNIISTPDDNGVKILKASDNSKLIEGDIIKEVNRESITTTNSFVKLVDEINKTGRKSILLKIVRDGESLWVPIQFK